MGSPTPGVEPWLPFGDLSVNVEDQRRDPESYLSLTRDLIGLRDALPDLRSGAYASVDAPDGVLAYQRGERTLVALEPRHRAGDRRRGHRDDQGRRRVRARDDEQVDGGLSLGPGEGAVVLLDVLPG